MMRYLTSLAVCLLLFAACTREWEDLPSSDAQGEGIRIVLSAESMELVETRAEDASYTEETSTEADSRVEHVIIYAFNSDGTSLLARYQQDLEYPDKEVRMMLPVDKGSVLLHAVCNYEKLWDENIGSVQDLENKLVSITQPDGAFNGSMVMHGTLGIGQADLSDKAKVNVIWVKRIAARVDFALKFDPEDETDKFYLGNVKVYNIPNRAYLVERVQDDPAAAGTDAATAAGDGNCFWGGSLLLQTEGEDLAAGVSARFYLFENRQGRESDEVYRLKFADNEDMWQTMKGEVGRKKYPQATYIQVSGTYVSDEGRTTQSATYDIYLGENNYSDFNVVRNSHYNITATIKTCNKLDTRVSATILNGAQITPAFNNPLDAHCNAVRCLGYTRNTAGWEVYVENPDEHPWLEVSLSSQYRPRIAGKTYMGTDGNELDPNMIASSRMEGQGAMAGYFYIHTDEYIPENLTADESLNNTTDPASWRTGYVVLRDKGNNSTYRLEVKQRPAQVVRMPVKNLLGQVTSYNEYFVEYELEEKNLTWGFLMYGANPVMTGMINDRWDGLSNTRKLYQEAVKIPQDPDDDSTDSGIYWGAYNGYYTVADQYPRSTDLEMVVNRIPDDHMIKYVLGKNRDRNGNGYIDYEEIVWYVPALDELAELYSAMHDAGRGNVFFQNSEDKFHSSTPYLAGYTAEVPGRAFYVKMGSGEKSFAMRDRQYNVICCRRKGAWTGNEDAGYEGGVTVDDEWNEDDVDVMPKQ